MSRLPEGAITRLSSNGLPEFYLKVTDRTEYGVTVLIHEVDGWHVPHTGEYEFDNEIGTLSLKWDGCAHLGLRDPELDNNWVHTCGPQQFRRYIDALEWAWKTAQDMIPKYLAKERL